MGANDRYRLLSSAVIPRPIAFVSTQARDGKRNLAPFSYFMLGGTEPPSLAFCPSLNRRGLPKDTLWNIEQSGEFVVNLVTREMAEGMNQASYEYDHGVEEWSASRFTPLESLVVKPPRVAESPIHFECQRFETVFHGDSAGSSAYVIGEIVAVHALVSILDDADGLNEAYQPIGRLGGSDYLDMATGERFDLLRPAGPANPRCV